MIKEAFPGGYQGEMRKPEDIAPLYLKLAAPDCEQHGAVVSVSEFMAEAA